MEPSASTRVIRCADDARGLGLFVADDFLSPEGCDRLAAIYRASADRYETYHRDPFWRGRLLSHRDVEDPIAIHDMRGVILSARREVQAFNGSPALYADVLHVVGWPTGWKMTPHADNTHESGEPHEFAWRDFSGVLYLSDDHEGGGLYLPGQDVLVEPRRGMFVSFPCGLSHMHGVTEVTAGLRITLAFFLTSNMERADRDLLSTNAARSEHGL